MWQKMREFEIKRGSVTKGRLRRGIRLIQNNVAAFVGGTEQSWVSQERQVVNS